jgi:S-adenosylmethionine-diacylglycerol 3-amino-3-carboxypropyl transferase
MANALLQQAAHQAPPASPRGMLERLFTLMFQGFVYNQIWEDPSVDLDALKLQSHHRVVTIASGGCNVLNYLTAAAAGVIALDLNPHHVALTKLKLAALEHLPDYETFFRFFGGASDPANLAAFDTYIRDKLDAKTRAYWQSLHGAPRPRRRIEMFARNLYRHGLLGRFIGLLHGVARLHGKKLEDVLEAKTPREQRQLFDSFTRWGSRRRNMMRWFRPAMAIRWRSCANAWNGWRATFPSVTIISPGRLSAADTILRAARRCPII